MSNSESQAERTRTRGNALNLIVSMADTTWRMFVPPAVLVTAGLWADLHWQTRPWLTLVGLAAGLALAVALVRVQLREAK